MNFDASDIDCESVQCAVCEKEITGGKWAARLKQGGHFVALCCPLCLDTFEADPHAYLRRIETLELLHSGSGPFQDDTPHLPPMPSPT